MTHSLNSHGRIDLPPFPTLVVILAALGMMIVVAPDDLVEVVGLLPLRQEYDHAFALVVLLLTAWGSWLIGVHMAVAHVRGQLLKKVPEIVDRLSVWQMECVLACLEAPDLTIRCFAYDSLARSVCELGLLLPPDGGGVPFRHDAPFTMPRDVAEAARAHLGIGQEHGSTDVTSHPPPAS